jgi:quercetin dioxygenase-like cupin family protein
LRLALQHHPGGAELPGPNTVVYDIGAGEAHFAPAQVEGEALSWTLVSDHHAPSPALLVSEVQLSPDTEWLMRCDRVEFEPGGVAYRHVHPGPGIRYLLSGQITIESGGHVDTYGPGQAWFERCPYPVLARISPSEPSAFARVLLVPAQYAGQRTIRYVDPADAEKPKTQKATVFCEAPVAAEQ